MGMLLAMFFSSCKETSRLELALRFAGENRMELEKVLKHYANDSLKYKAACFLIENMPYHYSYGGTDAQKFYDIIDSVSNLNNTKEQSFIQTDALKEALSGFRFENIVIEPDIQAIKADYLISHIDRAFDIKEYPWAKDVPFDVFCEYILPYRISNEPLEEWMDMYDSSLSNLKDTLKLEDTSFIDANIGQALLDGLRDSLYFMSSLMEFPFAIEFHPSSLLKLNVATCKEQTMKGLYSMRTLGIPVSWDFTPQWANRSRGHDWNALISTSDTIASFQIADNVPFGNHIKLRKTNDRFAKVYRKTYSIQDETLFMKKSKEEIPAFFRTPHIKDVTDLYVNTEDIIVELTTPAPSSKEFAYIMVFNNRDWVPIHWGKIKDGKVLFTKMAKNIAYVVMYYHDAKFYPASNPFILESNGQVRILSPDLRKQQTITLHRKYPVVQDRLDDIARRLSGGKFQIANRKDFKDAKTIHTIGSHSDMRPNYVRVNNSNSAKYFRYYSAVGGWVIMAEIEAYNSTGDKLVGNVIGTEYAPPNRRGFEFDKAFDGDPLTFYNAPFPSDCWVGLEFNQPETVTDIMFLPWNDDNFIQKDEIYDLQYYDKGWISLGMKTGDKTHAFTYKNVPDNALLRIRNKTKGKEERIFIFENDKQIWY